MKHPLLPILIATFFLSACATPTKEELTPPPMEQSDRKEPSAAEPAAPNEVTKPEAPEAAGAEPSLAPKEKAGSVDAKADMQVLLKTADGKLIQAPPPKSEIANKDSAAPETAPATTASFPAMGDAGSASQGAGVTADKALGWLKNGNRRFVRGHFRADGQSRADVRRLSKAQKPHSIVLSCSDSRVPPEIVFDQKLGELFVVRTSGLSPDNTDLAGLEYAHEQLGVHHLVVLGHAGCGAGTAAATQFLTEPWSGVGDVARMLTERSPALKDGIAAGNLKISQALYNLDTGEVEWK